MNLICGFLTIFLSAVSARRIDGIKISLGSARGERDTYVCEGDEGQEKFYACLEKYIPR